MGDTVWVLPEGTDEDGWDHSLVLKQEKELDKLAGAVGVRKLSEFYDFSILSEEFGGDSEPTYADSAEVHRTLTTLIDSIRSGDDAYKLKQVEGLLEELEDMKEKVKSASESGVRVRLAIVP